MTIEVLRTYRIRCDAAQCTTALLSETTDVPEGWTEIDSIAHQSHSPLPSVKSGRSLLRALDVRSIRSHGRFRLHLCPTHPDALADHLPRTDNAGGQGASVYCSCGARCAGSTQETKAAWLKHYTALPSGTQAGPA